MDVEVSFPEGERCVVLRFPARLRAASSAPLEHGITSIDGVVILQVPVDYCSDSPEEDLRAALSRMKLNGRFAGLMTAANVRKVFSIRRLSSDGVSAIAAVTAGVSNALVAGGTPLKKQSAGTINIVVVSDMALTDGGLVNAVITVTEAKCAVMKNFGFQAGGTSTDAVIVACPEGGEKLRYVGPATTVGGLMARAVREALTESLLKAGEPRSRSFLEKLKERGVTLEDIVEAAFALYIPHPGVSTEEVKRHFVEEINRLAGDVNINALVSSALFLEDLGSVGGIHGLSVEEFRSDAVHILADEVIGMAIAEYISGTRGVFNYVRYDRKKPGIIASLGPFLDDVVASLAGGVMSKILSS